VPGWFRIDRRAWLDFLITLVLLGAALLLALGSASLATAGDAVVAALAAIGALLLAGAGGLYIVPRLARRVRWEMEGIGIRTSVTTEGVVFLAIVVVVGVAAWNTENNLLYLVLASMLAFIVAAGNVARGVLRDVGVRLRLPDQIVANRPAKVAVTVTNRKRLFPSCSLSVEVEAERQELVLSPPKRRKRKKAGIDRIAHVIVVPPRSSVKQVVEYTFPKRGRYHVNGFTLSTKFPSGFFLKWRRIGAQGEVVVFPELRPIGTFFNSLPMISGSNLSHVKGEGVDLYGLRDYLATDHLHHIDWKATARTGRVIVRETALEEDLRLTIFFDATIPAAGADALFLERFEEAVVMAASLARHFTGEGAEVELVTSSARVPAGSGLGHLHKILTEISALVPAATGGDSAAVQLEDLPGVADDRRFKVLFTPARKGSIPASIWRAAHVVYFEELGS
jgi:uncharacterized protein (DUF58 family)